MPTPHTLSHRHQKLVLNGDLVTGLSDDDPPVDIPQIEVAKATFGADGTMYAVGTAMAGGEVTVKLLPVSPQVATWMQLFAQIQRGAKIIWNGTYEDFELGYGCKLIGGVLLEAPPNIVPGQNAEFKFSFEQLVPEFATAQFEQSVVAEITNTGGQGSGSETAHDRAARLAQAQQTGTA